MPMQRHLYPDNWEEIAWGVKEAAGWRCEECETQCVRPGSPKYMREYQPILTVAHLDHKPENCEYDNLKALCAPCHLRYDAPRKGQDRRRKRREALEAAGQMVAFELVQEG